MIFSSVNTSLIRRGVERRIRDLIRGRDSGKPKQNCYDFRNFDRGSNQAPHDYNSTAMSFF
jgi:hypothetical protein